MRRLLTQRSTEELAALFQEWWNQPAKLPDLLDELQNRKRLRGVAQ
jgi:hypothetical protein